MPARLCFRNAHGNQRPQTAADSMAKVLASFVQQQAQPHGKAHTETTSHQADLPQSPRNNRTEWKAQVPLTAQHGNPQNPRQGGHSQPRKGMLSRTLQLAPREGREQMWNSSSTSPELMNVLYWALLQSLANVGKLCLLNYFCLQRENPRGAGNEKQILLYAWPSKVRPRCIHRGSTKKKERGNSE